MTAHLIFAPMDMRVFNRWAADRGLVKHGTFDQGFALHVLLSATFGKGVLQPFRLISSPRRHAASLYAYADEDQTALQRVAETVATPDCLEALDTGRLRSKRMRMEYSTGQHLGFDLRVRPVRRLHGEVAHVNGRVLAKGSEIDVFVTMFNQEPSDGAARLDQPSAARREAIYVSWLAERFGDAAEIDAARCRMTAFSRSRAVRGDRRGPEGPDAVIQGVLMVSNPERFVERIRSGIGRHKAYGYGMVLLRPTPSGYRA